MKKIIAGILFLTLLMGATMNVGAAFDRSYTAPKGTPIIDGEIDEVWSTAEWTAVDKPFDGTADTDSVIYAKLLWDDSKLYFLAYIYDSEENKRNDIFEVYIDQNNNKATGYSEDDCQTRFYVAGGVVEGEADVAGQNSQQDAQNAAKALGDNLYVVEGALDWPAGTPAIGQEMGLEFMYNDGSLYEAFVEAYRWNVDTTSDDEPPYAGTSAFGTLVLADAGTPSESGSKLPEIKVGTDTDKKADTDTETKSDAEPGTDIEADKDEAGFDWTIILYVAIVAVAIAVIAILVVRKKKSA